MAPPVKVALATIVLNEAAILPRLIEQHRDWPGLVAWVFVEGATGLYGDAHPDAVSRDGLSVDATGRVLTAAAIQDSRVHYARHGWARGPELNSGHQKTKLRSAYCEELDRVAPDSDILIVIDADEFYTRQDQARINRLCARGLDKHDAWMLRQRHLWRPPSIAKRPAAALEVVGGYWGVPHVRVWRWRQGSRYWRNHNHLQHRQSRPFDPSRMYRFRPGDPECVHVGFARRDAVTRTRTNAYYVHRGEGGPRDRKRRMYVDCRGAWAGWKPGRSLPHGARVVRYDGPVPEVLRDA